MAALRQLVSLLAPPRCAACRRGCRIEAVLCPRCEAMLAAAGPLPGAGWPQLDAAWAAAPHVGVARELVAALKFRRLLPVAALMAERIVSAAPSRLLTGVVVPVPADPWRLMRRGFDPAEEIATRLAVLAGLRLCRCLARDPGRRQVGRRRAERLAEPPRVRVVGELPRSTVLVDDVQTTGATLEACARALRARGAERVVALTFARKP